MAQLWQSKAMTNTAISVSDLSKKYEDRLAVSHINFEVPLGTVCGFVGPNGSGKTTTMRMLLGLITPTTGQGHILGEPIEHPEKYLSRVTTWWLSYRTGSNTFRKSWSWGSWKI
jgi:ABC-type multidrug transport system ATPase subunit